MSEGRGGRSERFGPGGVRAGVRGEVKGVSRR